MRFQTHQLRQHLRAWYHGNRSSICLDNLRVVITNSRRTNDHVWLSDIFRRMTFKDLNAHSLQAIGDSGCLQVRSRDAETKIDQHLGNPGHTDAADADEVNVLN